MDARRLCLSLLLPFLLALACAAQAVPAPRVVTLTAPEGSALKATYFSAAKPGPGVLLFHQCNRQRKVWDGLAAQLSASGINVLTLDYRGFGESDGAPFDKMTPEGRRKLVTEIWPRDLDQAFQYLLSQPGVVRDAIGAGGASCGVNNSIQLARRHPEVKSLVLLSGPTDREGRLFLQSKGLPIFVSAADDDEFGNSVEPLQWWFSASPNPASRFAHYPTGGHGSDMFAANRELPDLITRWFVATLTNNPGSVPPTNGSRLQPQVIRTLELIDQPGGASQVEKTLARARTRDPHAILFPEFIVNLIGYEHVQLGDTVGAIEILKLNAAAYPTSPNAYDSLSDAYLAAGQKDLALTNAKKALELIADDKSDTEQRRNGIRDNAAQKVKQLEKTGT